MNNKKCNLRSIQGIQFSNKSNSKMIKPFCSYETQVLKFNLELQNNLLLHAIVCEYDL